MRVSGALALATLMLLSMAAAPGVHAQAPTGDVPLTAIADDGPGDVKIVASGQTQAPPADRMGNLDLRHLDVQETLDTFDFMLTVTKLQADPQQIPLAEQASYQIYFHNLDRNFRILIQPANGFGNGFAGVPEYFARLQASDPGRGGYFNVPGEAPKVTTEVPTNLITVSVPRQSMLDGYGSAPHPEVPLTGFRVVSLGLFQQQRNLPSGSAASAPLPKAGDNMPDSGNATVDLQVKFGVVQSGHARLHSDTPTRASNGEATTFVYQVTGINLGAAEDRFTLTATGAPSTWQVRLPASQLSIPGNGTVTFPVLVTTPFTHTHGAFNKFTLEMASISDPATVGRIEIGVRYVQPPQPAGHHDKMWIYSQSDDADTTTSAFAKLFHSGSFNQAIMNAEENYPDDDKLPVPADFCGNGGLFSLQVDATAPTQTTCIWEVPLSPGLELGLDFNPAKTEGVLHLPISTVLPMPSSVMTAAMFRIGPPDGRGTGNNWGFFDSGNVSMVAFMPSVAKDVGANEQTTFDLSIVAMPGGDFVRYEKGASLVMMVMLNFTRPPEVPETADFPQITPGGYLDHLPLDEYHDPVTDVFLTTVELVANGAQDRLVNPGKAVLYNVTVVNHGTKDATYLIEVAGTNHEWAKILLSDPNVPVGAGKSATVQVAVNVPADAQQGQAADLVLSATDPSDFNVRSLLRLFATVDTSAEHADDTALVQAAEGNLGAEAPTPGFEALLLVAAVAAAALVVQRRRQA